MNEKIFLLQAKKEENEKNCEKSNDTSIIEESKVNVVIGVNTLLKQPAAALFTYKHYLLPKISSFQISRSLHFLCCQCFTFVCLVVETKMEGTK